MEEPREEQGCPLIPVGACMKGPPSTPNPFVLLTNPDKRPNKNL